MKKNDVASILKLRNMDFNVKSQPKNFRLRSLLNSIGLKPSKRFSQHFLIDEKISERIIDYAKLSSHDAVLEIGPGLGVLTKKMVKKANVIGIEKDKKLCEYLKKIPGLTLINNDALKTDFPKFDKIVSNLPYHLSSPLTFKILEHDFKLGVLMYQKEFAERMTALSGRDYSRLSVNIYYRAECKILETVPRTSFYPVPKVDSAVVSLKPRKPPFIVENESIFFKTVDTVFSQRRKKTKNSLLNNWKKFTHEKGKMENIVENIKNKNKRPEELSPEEIGEISDIIAKHIIR
ncbi:MAG: 16S rRNA (adenine(1518)-N(6)/adenine(1519)-N(6))-dimethyltransferase RsmA [Thermoplasmatales archaeon]|nr:16S rRNA (adenine(1518)-N(6)/adenine(1519)-N(6))-dimethyltransferase RsmA [Thermoplasmatales archaeon]